MKDIRKKVQTMQMPVNITEVFKIATDMKDVASTPISVSIYLDDTAPGVLIGHVRSAFASAGEHTRVTIEYIDEGVRVKPGEDMAVIVAGTLDMIGEAAANLREASVPVMVVTDSPATVSKIAASAGHPIPAADIVAPVKLETAAMAKLLSIVPFARGRKMPQDKMPQDAPAGSSPVGELDGDVAVSDDGNVGEMALNEESLGVLDSRMGKWIISACSEKDLAFALSFPFIRRPLAMDAITATSMQNGAVGLVPFLPGADMPIMTLNQIKMTLQIATAYGCPVDKDRVKEIAAVVGGAFVCRHVVRSVTKVVPFAGWLVSGGMGFAATEAMGHALLEYFEAGGDIVGVASVMQTARDAAMDASRQVAGSPMGQRAMARAKDIASSAMGR